MSKAVKAMQLDDLRASFKGVRDLVVLHFDKLGSLGEYTLRKNLREKKIKLKQVKNTLTRLIFKEMEMSIPDDSPYWQKSSIMAFGQGSISEISKAVEAEVKNPKNSAMYKDKVVIKGAIADGQPVAFDVATKMPTRLELIGQIVGAMLSPAMEISGGLCGAVSQVSGQIDTISKKTEDAPAA